MKISNSVTYRNYLKFKDKLEINIDNFLDWRNRLNELRQSGQFPDEWYQNEINACDKILKELNG